MNADAFTNKALPVSRLSGCTGRRDVSSVPEANKRGGPVSARGDGPITAAKRRIILALRIIRAKRDSE